MPISNAPFLLVRQKLNTVSRTQNRALYVHVVQAINCACARIAELHLNATTVPRDCNFETKPHQKIYWVSKILWWVLIRIATFQLYFNVFSTVKTANGLFVWPSTMVFLPNCSHSIGRSCCLHLAYGTFVCMTTLISLSYFPSCTYFCGPPQWETLLFDDQNLRACTLILCPTRRTCSHWLCPVHPLFTWA